MSHRSSPSSLRLLWSSSFTVILTGRGTARPSRVLPGFSRFRCETFLPFRIALQFVHIFFSMNAPFLGSPEDRPEVRAGLPGISAERSDSVRSERSDGSGGMEGYDDEEEERDCK